MPTKKLESMRGLETSGIPGLELSLHAARLFQVVFLATSLVVPILLAGLGINLCSTSNVASIRASFRLFQLFLRSRIRDVPTGFARCSFDCVGGASEATRPKRASQARPADLAVAVL